MADMQTLYRALQNAHAAGDVQAATQLATYIKSMQGRCLLVRLSQKCSLLMK